MAANEPEPDFYGFRTGYTSVSSLRLANGRDYKRLRRPVVLSAGPEPVAVIVPYGTYLKWIYKLGLGC